MARASPDLPTLTLPLKFIMPMAPLVGSAVANGTGEFVVTLSPAQTDGGTLTAIAIDRAGITARLRISRFRQRSARRPGHHGD